MNDKKDNIFLEEYENKFSYKISKTNLNIEFNRIAFIFFVFLIISIIYSIQLLHLGSLKIQNEIKPLIKKTKKINAILLKSTFKFVLFFLYENLFSYSSKITLFFFSLIV